MLALKLLRGEKNPDALMKEIEQLESEAQNQIEKRSLWSVIRDSTLLLPLILVCVMQAGHQLGGINTVGLGWVFFFLIIFYLKTSF